MKTIYKSLFFVIFISLFFSCKENTTEPLEPTAFDEADGIKGGIMYDKFWSTEATYPQTNTALISKLNTYADFFKCKQCHAWDLLGTSGSYNNRGPKTNRPNVSVLNLVTLVNAKTEQQLFDGIKTGSVTRRDTSYNLATYPTTPTIGDQMPNYSQLLTDDQIWDIVKFFKKEALDVTQLYDATYTGVYPTGKTVFSNIGKDGNATNGRTYYNSKCVTCHGSDGKLIQNLDATAGMTLGKFIRTKSNEAQHKIKFGQLGSTPPMLSSKSTPQEMKDLYKSAADTTIYPN